jgi:hypothetical protein
LEGWKDEAGEREERYSGSRSREVWRECGSGSTEGAEGAVQRKEREQREERCGNARRRAHGTDADYAGQNFF